MPTTQPPTDPTTEPTPYEQGRADAASLGLDVPAATAALATLEIAAIMTEIRAEHDKFVARVDSAIAASATGEECRRLERAAASLISRIEAVRAELTPEATA